jgi:hypothetical protein
MIGTALLVVNTCTISSWLTGWDITNSACMAMVNCIIYWIGACNWHCFVGIDDSSSRKKRAASIHQVWKAGSAHCKRKSCHGSSIMPTLSCVSINVEAYPVQLAVDKMDYYLLRTFMEECGSYGIDLSFIAPAQCCWPVLPPSPGAARYIWMYRQDANCLPKIM